MRRLLAAFTVLILAGLIAFLIYERIAGKRQTIAALSFDDRAKAAFDLRQETSRGFFQVTVVIIGALWGIVIVQQPFKTWGSQENSLFVLANVALILSVLAHTRYSIGLSDTLIDAVFSISSTNSIPDFTVKRLDFYFTAQEVLFLAGSVLSGFTFLSARLKQ